MVRNILAKALVALLPLSSRTLANPAHTETTLEDIQNQALTNAYRVLDGTLSDGLSRSPNTNCNKSTIAIRKELSSLTALIPYQRRPPAIRAKSLHNCGILPPNLALEASFHRLSRRQIPLRRLHHCPHQHDTHDPRDGKLPTLAPLLCLGVRNRTPH